MIHSTDIDLETGDILELGSLDAIVSFFNRLGYDTDQRAPLTPEAIGLSGDAANSLKKIELISEDSEGFLRVVFAQSKSLTAKVRNDLARVLGKSTTDHMVVLTADYTTVECVFLDKRRKQSKGPAGIERVQVVPKTISVNRRVPTRLDLRILRRFTWTCQDALDQFDKLRSVFDAAAYTGKYFQNRGLFSDYFLRERLREDDNWSDNPSDMFAHVRDFMADAPKRWSEKEKDVVRKELFAPIFKKLGFKPRVNRPAKTDQTQPDYLLKDDDDNVLTAAFVYQWDRWLDGPDLNDPDTPEENPGACVVTALDEGIADWIIVTNGRHWRLYGKQAHARSTNFYEVDLIEALLATGDTDPNEAFRYWWLFFRPGAYTKIDDACWLDTILQGSRDYAKRLGDRLKDRVFLTIFPHLAQGFLADRKNRLGVTEKPTGDELGEIFEATLTLLYRLLFLLFAESRGLVPINEAPYQTASLKKIKDKIAEKAGVAESDVADAIKKCYSATETNIYDSLAHLFHVMAEGDASLNVPKYNGGLFNTTPTKERAESDSYEDRNHRIGQFLIDHKIPDRQLALAIDRLSRDQDERTLALAFIDYKSLEVRHLGSIYEGLLEFKLKVASEDLTTKTEKGKEKFISLSEVSARRRSSAEVVVKKNAVYLSNDKAERKASGSYYTPDPIVEYIVANTVGPVLDKKLEALRPEFRKVRKTFNNEIKKAKVAPIPQAIQSGEMNERQWANLKTYQAHKELVEQMFDFHACDPAMGSGHFLVEVVDFVTDRMLKFLNKFPINPVNYALERTRSSIIESLGDQGVTVDPANLTDINLLKRHVLKRCIYGVDVNPMAVELAKVSLWLDCFTLGAPLNFLDHHLRCGNSLIGATFADLAKATTGRLFTIKYEPLLRAINHVLQVSKLADATAAEVATSASTYDNARRELTGYQVILDLLVAEHFGFPTAPSIVTDGADIDFQNRDKLLESLRKHDDERLEQLQTIEDDDEREEKLEAFHSEHHTAMDVIEVAKRPDIRFFHWEIEFPEIFFGFVDDNQRQLRHKDQIDPCSAGFDCVVGNPPYVNVVELPKPLRDWLLHRFNFAVGRVDIYIPFFESAMHLICNGGRTAFITPNKWYVYSYGLPLRQALLTGGFRWHSAVDLSLAQSIFPDANTYTQISVIERIAEPHDRTNIKVTRFLSDDCDAIRNLQRAEIEGIVEGDTIPSSVFAELPQCVFAPRLNTRRLDLLRCIFSKTIEVGDVFDVEQLIRIGSKAKRAELVRLGNVQQDGDARRIIDADELQEWTIDWEGRYLLYRPDELYNAKSPEIFEQPKIFIKDTSDRLQVVPDFGSESSAEQDRWFYALNTVYGLIPRTRKSRQYIGAVAACLNSPLSDFLYKLLFGALTIRGGYIRYREFVQFLRIPSDLETSGFSDETRFHTKCSELFAQAIDGAEEPLFDDLLNHVETRDNEQQLLRFVGHLAEQLTRLNSSRVAIRQRFIGDLVGRCASMSSGEFELGSLRGASSIRAFCGDYESEPLEFSALWDVVEQNRRLFVDGGLPNLRNTLGEEYQSTLAELVPLLRQLRATRNLLNTLVFRLFGLSANDIQVVNEVAH